MGLYLLPHLYHLYDLVWCITEIASKTTHIFINVVMQKFPELSLNDVCAMHYLDTESKTFESFIFQEIEHATVCRYKLNEKWLDKIK